MKTNEIHLIDRKALRQLRELHPELSELELAQILLAELKEELLELRQEQQRAQTPVENKLASLARLRPDDEQLRRALLRLLALRDASQERPLLHKKTHWLAVCRALQHIGYITDGHGAWVEAERKINALLPMDRENYPPCSKHEMSRKATTSPFTLSLSKWEKYSLQADTMLYWEISKRFLQFLQAECTSECTLI